MSDRPCNYCSYKRIEEDARKKGKRVVRIPSTKMESLGGYEVHLLGQWEKPNEKNWIAWMMEITETCQC